MIVDHGRSMNTPNDPITNAWINLFICITTNDMNEFYMALSGHTPNPNSKKHYTWEEVNKTAQVKDYKRHSKLKVSR